VNGGADGNGANGGAAGTLTPSNATGQCRTVTRRVCRDSPQGNCRTVPRQRCELERGECRTVPQEQCRKELPDFSFWKNYLTFFTSLTLKSVVSFTKPILATLWSEMYRGKNVHLPQKLSVMIFRDRSAGQCPSNHAVLYHEKSVKVCLVRAVIHKKSKKLYFWFMVYYKISMFNY
jgi:hypothetical protein